MPPHLQGEVPAITTDPDPERIRVGWLCMPYRPSKRPVMSGLPENSAELLGNDFAQNKQEIRSVGPLRGKPGAEAMRTAGLTVGGLNTIVRMIKSLPLKPVPLSIRSNRVDCDRARGPSNPLAILGAK